MGRFLGVSIPGRSPAAASTPLRSIGSCCISGTFSRGVRFTPRPPAGEPAMPPVRPVNGPADRSYLMPARTKPVRTALPGFAFAAILLLAGCGGASQETSAAPLTRASSLCGQVANSQSTGETGWTRGGSSSASAICRVSSSISARAAPARPQPPAVGLAPSPGLPDPPLRSGGPSGVAASSPAGHFDVRQAQRDYPSRRTADRCRWRTARERCTSDERPGTGRRR
jgi:hypothetical protein